MDWITDEIALGDWRDAQDSDLLRRECIWSMLSLIGMFVGRSAESLGVQRVECFPLLDGPGDDLSRFTRAVDLLARLVQEGPPVFVHCRAGRSRCVPRGPTITRGVAGPNPNLQWRARVHRAAGRGKWRTSWWHTGRAASACRGRCVRGRQRSPGRCARAHRGARSNPRASSSMSSPIVRSPGMPG